MKIGEATSSLHEFSKYSGLALTLLNPNHWDFKNFHVSARDDVLTFSLGSIVKLTASLLGKASIFALLQQTPVEAIRLGKASTRDGRVAGKRCGAEGL